MYCVYVVSLHTESTDSVIYVIGACKDVSDLECNYNYNVHVTVQKECVV